ncbi:MAG: NmrA/HSCARG family protein [Actinomycetota bacterium]|nr:NmrA/HSCARG family protein [Actinomycetota bacterium]MDH5223485.1 NmrA/HSCARG family protein [Actinomycetota bacterium]MDH5314198.1 NmrA/HSCARG family protein [Actinomycetota bacterium]
MSDGKVIAVVGATGTQGGGLARAILDDPEEGFTVRALTRNPDSDAAHALAERGADVVQADLDDQASLATAFAGAHGVFGVTNYWEVFSVQREQAQAANIARASVEAGVHHVIWSTLEDTRKWIPLHDDRMPTLAENYKVPHFDGKGEADGLFAEAGAPTTYLATAFFWESLFGMVARGDDGVLALTLPMGEARLPGIAGEDVGRTAYGVFERGDELIGSRVAIAGEHLRVFEMVATLSEVLGEEVRYQDVPPEVFRSFGFPGADDIGNMFQFKHDFEDDYVGARDLDVVRSLNPELQSFEDWARANKDRFGV